MELDNPIKTVPVNILSQTVEASPAGVALGLTRIYRAYLNKFEGMKPGELDTAFRNLKAGTVGTAAMMAGWYFYENLGGTRPSGMFQKPESGGKDKLKEGQVKVGDATLPGIGFHNETWQAAQVMASYRHLLDKQYGKGKVEADANLILRAALGIAENTPGFKQTLAVQMATTLNPKKALSQWVASRAVPSPVSQIARWLDTPGELSFETFMKETTKRYPRDTADEFKARIPGLRQEVPKTRNINTSHRK